MRRNDLGLGDGLALPVYQTDNEGQIISANQALVDLLGYPSPESLIKQNVNEIYTDPNSRKRFVELMNGATEPVSFEQELLHFSGRTLWVRDCARTTRDDKGRVIGFEGALLDVTAQKTAIDDLAANEERYRNLFNLTPIALWEEDFSALLAWLDHLRSQGIEDLRGFLDENPDELARGIELIRIVDVNQAAINLVGAETREDLVGHIPTELLSAPGLEAFVEQMMAVWEHRRTLSIDIRGQTFQGDQIHCHLDWVISPDEADTSNGLPVVAAITDITDRELARRNLDHITEARDRFISSAAHQLRTPLTVAMGFASELATRWDALEPDQRREYANLVAVESTRIAHMVEDLLVVARSDIGSLTILPEWCDLAKEAREALIEVADPSIVTAMTPTKVWGDPFRIRQIIYNLVSNALQHGEAPIRLQTKLSVDHATIEIRDAGVASHGWESESLFERYSKRSSQQGTPGPLGIGLTVARTLARLMNGDLTHDADDTGTSFSLSLPTTQPRL